MNIVVVIASRHGSTREIGAAITEVLQEAGHTVAELNAQDVDDMERYDAAVVGSAVYMGNWLPEAREFIKQNRAALSRKPLWLFSSGPIGPSTPAVDTEHLEGSVGLSGIRDHRVFAGKLDTDQLGFGERLTVRLVKAPEGDFREWGDIREWARHIAVALTPRAAAVP